jgi:hypothetical protein
VPARCGAMIAATFSVTRGTDRQAEAAGMGSAGAARQVSPDRNLQWQIEASDVPLCTSLAQDQTMEIGAYYQKLEGILELRCRVVRISLCSFYGQAVSCPASIRLPASGGR